MTEGVAVFPPADSHLGWGSWIREIVAASVDTVLPPSRSPGALPRGDGSAVLLIPGFLSGDWATAGLRRFLAELGYAPHTAHILFNAGPTNATVRRLDRKVEQLSRSAPVSIVGVSLGGTLARDLARRHAGLVRCVITLCSPLRFPRRWGRSRARWHPFMTRNGLRGDTTSVCRSTCR